MHQSTLSGTVVRGVLVMLLLGALAVSCKDQEKCDEAIRTTRQALGMEDTDSARQWRNHTWKVCADSAVVASLDQEIVAKEKEVVQREENARKQEQELAQKRVDQAKKYWTKYDKLEEKEQTKKALKNVYKRAKKLVKGLAAEYVKQLQDFNTKQYKKRLAKLDSDK